MAGIKQSWTIGGSILVAAASGLIAVAEDSPFPRPNAAVSEQPVLVPSPAPVSESMAVPRDSARSYPYAQTYCQPCQTSRFGRFKQRCQAKYWGYPEEFCEPPLGSMLLGYQMTQVANGQAARMALYQYDFLPASDQLNARGKAQLAKIAIWLPTNAFPVFVEPTPASPDLDERRRLAVWHELSTNHFSIPSGGVIVGRPNVRGLDAGDALLLDRNRLGLTASRGISSGGGGASVTSTSTGGATGTTGQ
ncbi:MAG: hypothetical protein H7062_26335 [Candidatus Saccharimonas sp.]|nr:hypothetical protein [Planctomycetaceae bacterium]